MERAENTELSFLGDYSACGRSLRRQRRFFLGAVFLFVVIASFTYGLVRGLAKNSPLAHAHFPAAPGNPGAQYVPAEGTDLPDGVLVMPVGSEAAINGKTARILAFVSKRKVRALVEDQLTKWQARGLTAFALGTGSRGVVVAFDPRSGERHVLNAWRVPKELRRASSAGMPVQGVVTSASGMEAQFSLEQEREGLVPGVPIYPGGSAGAVFTNRDDAVRTYSALYRSPAGVSENLAFYRRELGARGWSEQGGEIIDRPSGAVGHLSLEREGQELTILFSPASPLRGAGAAQGVRSVALVTLGPKQYQPPF